MLKVVAEKAAGEELAFGIDEICREGARRMLAVALEAEVDADVTEHLEDRDEQGHRRVVRNGRVELVPITIGHDFGSTVEVTSGITPQDQVILDPSDSLISGIPVEIGSVAGSGSAQ